MAISHQLFINGQWQLPAGTESISVITPANEQTISSVPLANSADFIKAEYPELFAI